LKDGFSMLQYSVYLRYCPSRENMEVHINYIKRNLPQEGKVSVMFLTDKQFECIYHFWGVEQVPAPGSPQQLELF